MKTQTDNLGKVSVTVEKDYWSPSKAYDKLTIVQVENKFATYISRKPVPTGMSLGNREYWIPFSSLKELIILDYSKINEKVNDLADVAYSGKYEDLKDKPDISNKTITLKRSDGTVIGDFKLNQSTDKEITINLPAAQIQADWKLTDPTATDFIKNKPNLKAVATTGSYHDLLDVPEIGQGKLIFTDGTNIRNNQFDANTTDNVTVALSKVAFTNEYKDLNGRHPLTINQNGTSTIYDGTEDKTITISNQRVNNGELSIQKNGNEVAKFTADQANNTTVNLSKVAFTGDYSDLSGTPTVGNGTISIKCNNVLLDTFTTNLAEPKDINIIVPNAQGQPVVQVQSDWNEADPSDPAYINNKPTIGNGKVTVKLGSMEQTFRVNDLGDTTITLQVANNGILTIRDNEQNNVHNFYADDAGNEVVVLHKSAFSGNYDDLNNTPQGVLTLTRNGLTLATFSANDRSQQSVELGTPGDTNTIESVSVNRVPVPIDPNKNVDLTIGDAVINIKLNGSLIQSFSLNQTGAPIDINLTDTVGDLNKIESISVNGNTQQIINKNVDLTIPPSGDINTIETISVNGLNQQIINKNVDLTITPGDTNKIESISINGVTLQIDLTKNVDIPLKTLTIVDPNGQRYTYNATSDVTIQLPVGQSTAGFSYEVYSNRNLITNPQTNVLYLIGPGSNDYGTHDRFEEWIYTSNLGWAKIGTTEIDLSQYYTRTLVDNLIGNGTLTINVGNNAPVTFSANEPTNSNQQVTIGDGAYNIYQGGVLKGTIQANASHQSPLQINLDGGGDVNIIEEVQVNGQSLTPDNNKAVNVQVPTVDKYSKNVFYSYRLATLGIWTSDVFNQPNISTLFFAKFIGQDTNLTNYSNIDVLFSTWSTPRWTLPIYYRGSVLSGRILNTLIEYPNSSQSKSLVFYYDVNTPTYVSLVGVYDSEGSYSRTLIDNMLSNINSFGYEFYTNVNNVANPNSQTLYIIGPSGSGDDYYEEFVYSNGNFVKIGDITKDLSIYAQISSLSRVAFSGNFNDLNNIPHDSLDITYGRNNPRILGTFNTNTGTAPQTINIPDPGNGSLIIRDENSVVRELFYANQDNDHYLDLANIAFTGDVADLHGYVAPGQVNDGQLSINELDRSNNIVNTHLFTANQPTGTNVNVNLRSVAFTGDYNDLINTPPSVSTPLDGHLEINNVDNTNHTLQLYNFTADQLTGTVTQVNLRQVAFTADYNHLINRPNAVGVNPGNGLFVVTRTDNGGNTTNAANFTADEPTGNVITLPLHEVAFTGSYSSLSGAPAAAENGTLIINRISNSILWRTPDSSEFNYILYSRSTQNKFVKCNFDGKNCLVLFPDNYTIPTLSTSLLNVNLANTSYFDNMLSLADATLLSNDGCVILPLIVPAGSLRYWMLDMLYMWSPDAGIYLTPSSNFSMQCYVRLVSDSNIGIGAFTTNANGDTISFAPGNLQYRASDGDWRFAVNQYDIIGTSNSNRSATYANYIDLFAYGTSSYRNNQVEYMPYAASTNNSDYYSGTLNGTTADWGYAYSIAHNRYSYTFTANEPTPNVVTVNLSEVAFTGNYNDLQGIPPSVNAGNGLIDIISPQSNNTQSFTVNLPGSTQIYLPRETYTPTKTTNGVLYVHNVNLPLGDPIPDLTTIVLSNINPHDVETIGGEPIFIGNRGNTQLTSTNSVFYNGLVVEFRLTVSKIYSTSGVVQRGYNLVHWSYTQNAGSGGGETNVLESVSIDGQAMTIDTNRNTDITREYLLGCNIVEAQAEDTSLHYNNLITTNAVTTPTILLISGAKPHDYTTLNGLPLYKSDNVAITHQNSPFIDDAFDMFHITVYPDNPVTPTHYRIIHYSYWKAFYTNDYDSEQSTGGSGSTTTGNTTRPTDTPTGNISIGTRINPNTRRPVSGPTISPGTLTNTNSAHVWNNLVGRSGTSVVEGVLNKTYTVGSNNGAPVKVYFTSGNLTYNQGVWGLHEHQWDIYGLTNVRRAGSQCWDVFNYGCNNYDANSYYANKCRVDNWSTGYLDHITSQISLTNFDWGRSYDYARWSRNQNNRFYTLTAEEWDYLLYTRPNLLRRFALGTYSYLNVIIIIPDDNNTDPVTLNDINGGTFSSNTFNLTLLQTLSNAGYVILPSAGARYGSTWLDFNSVANYFILGTTYWTGGHNGSPAAVGFTANSTTPLQTLGHPTLLAGYGLPVRLVLKS